MKWEEELSEKAFKISIHGAEILTLPETISFIKSILKQQREIAVVKFKELPAKRIMSKKDWEKFIAEIPEPKGNK